MEFNIYAIIMAVIMLLMVVALVAHDMGRTNQKKACNDDLDFSRRTGTRVRVVDAEGNVHRLYLVSEYELATLRGQAKARSHDTYGEEHY